LTDPATKTKSIGLPPTHELQWFLLPNLESFIVTRQLLLI